MSQRTNPETAPKLTHLRFVGGVIYCSVARRRLSLGSDHKIGDGFTCPYCGTEVDPR